MKKKIEKPFNTPLEKIKEIPAKPKRVKKEKPVEEYKIIRTTITEQTTINGPSAEHITIDSNAVALADQYDYCKKFSEKEALEIAIDLNRDEVRLLQFDLNNFINGKPTRINPISILPAIQLLEILINGQKYLLEDIPYKE